MPVDVTGPTRATRADGGGRAQAAPATAPPHAQAGLGGDPVARYERAFGTAAGAGHAIAFTFGRTALGAILRGVGLQSGDLVALSPLTCRVVPLALLGAGFVPAYVDIRADTLNLDAEALRAAAGAGARAILFQHTYGWSSGVEDVARAARALGLPLVEDCAQSLPDATAGGPGRHGIAGIFSNNPGKPLPAGSGGVAVTDDPVLAERVRAERDALPVRSWLGATVARVEAAARRRLPPSLYWPALGLHSRLHGRGAQATLADEIEREVHAVAQRPSVGDAARGERWIERLEEVRAHRRACSDAYAAGLERKAGVDRIPGAGGALYYHPVLLADKQATLVRARRARVQLVAWPDRTPIYPVEPADLARYGYEAGSCPIAEAVAARLVGLPTDLAIDGQARSAVLGLLRDR